MKRVFYFLIFLAAIFAAFIIRVASSESDDAIHSPYIVYGLMAALWLAVDWDARRSNRGKRFRMNAALDQLLDQHADTLAIKKSQTVTVDEFGVIDQRKWIKVIDHFYANVVLPRMAQEKAKAYFMLSGPTVADLIEARITTAKVNASYSPQMPPAAYERLTGEVLTGEGWLVQVTQLSGDQGTDVYALKNGISIVLQCKLYSSPVGNKAVQEVVAARGHMKANFAAVVSNAPYTPAARQLAASNGVELLHHDSLATYAQSISSKAWPDVAPGATSIMPPPTTF